MHHARAVSTPLQSCFEHCVSACFRIVHTHIWRPATHDRIQSAQSVFNAGKNKRERHYTHAVASPPRVTVLQPEQAAPSPEWLPPQGMPPHTATCTQDGGRFNARFASSRTKTLLEVSCAHASLSFCRSAECSLSEQHCIAKHAHQAGHTCRQAFTSRRAGALGEVPGRS